jgi:glycosyltransferase involved in cell wall biosynthesis
MSSTQRVKVLLLIPHLGGGGAERVTETLARCLSPEKYEVNLGLVTQAPQEMRNVPLLNAFHALGARRVRYGAWKILRLVWLVRPAVIMSGMAHLNLLVLALRPLFPSRTRVLVRQNGGLTATFAARGNSWLSQRIYSAMYKRADLVICQTRQMVEELHSTLRIDRAKLVVLPNPVDIAAINASAAVQSTEMPTSPSLHLLAVARLAPEKGIDLLLEAFAGVLRRCPSADLVIAGDGSCRPALERQCKLLGIEKRVKFLGSVAEPASLFHCASLFVLSSREEAMPNALLEAAAAGLPIVATPASQGLVELLSDQLGICLARDISAKALEDSLCDALSSIRAGQRFPHAWVEPFDLKNSIPAYERVIDQALQERALQERRR